MRPSYDEASRRSAYPRAVDSRSPVRRFLVRAASAPSGAGGPGQMRYLMLIYTPEVDPSTVSPEQRAATSAKYGEFTREARERNVMEGGEALQDTTSATTVRVRDGKTLVTDGPYAE